MLSLFYSRLTIISSLSDLPSSSIVRLNRLLSTESPFMKPWMTLDICRCTHPMRSAILLHRADLPDLGRPRTTTRGLMLKSDGVGLISFVNLVGSFKNCSYSS
jgi:hypothetical protein